ncbi:hypothetical protein ACET3Z_031421 [Daucus carota]
MEDAVDDCGGSEKKRRKDSLLSNVFSYGLEMMKENRSPRKSKVVLGSDLTEEYFKKIVDEEYSSIRDTPHVDSSERHGISDFGSMKENMFQSRLTSLSSSKSKPCDNTLSRRRSVLSPICPNTLLSGSSRTPLHIQSELKKKGKGLKLSDKKRTVEQSPNCTYEQFIPTPPSNSASSHVGFPPHTPCIQNTGSSLQSNFNSPLTLSPVKNSLFRPPVNTNFPCNKNADRKENIVKSAKDKSHSTSKNEQSVILGFQNDDSDIYSEEEMDDEFVYAEVPKSAAKDVIGVITAVQDRAMYMKDEVEKSHVLFTITDGKTSMNVTFFNEFGDEFLYERARALIDPEIIVITSAKVNEWKDQLYLTNFPGTRFYFKPKHPSVEKLKKRQVTNCFLQAEPGFYVLPQEDEKEEVLQTLKINELKKLTEAHIEKVDEKMSWYICFCTQCDIQILLEDGTYKCGSCGRIIPYPDKRFQLYTLCSDETGIIPVVWPNDEIVRLTGKEIYEVEAELDEAGDDQKFPAMLKFPQKKLYNFTLLLTKENVKEGSNV